MDSLGADKGPLYVIGNIG